MERHNGLDAIYAQVLSDAPSSASNTFRRIMGTLLCLRISLSMNDLASLLRFEDPKTIWVDLEGCGSILMIPEDLDKDIRFFHASLRDFFADIARSKTLFIDVIKQHLSILDDCIQIMTSEFTSSLDGKRTSSAVSYACKNWYHHIIDVVQKDNGIKCIISHFGARLVKFLECIKDNWFGLWLKKTSPFRAVEYDVFMLASITKVSADPRSEGCCFCSHINKGILS
jgi:hypothetical protein